MGEIEDSLMSDLIEFRKVIARRCRLARMVLFGSYATGKAGKDSDLDILLVSPDFDGTPFHLRPVEIRLLWERRLPMDLFCLTPSEFDSRARSISIVRQALSEGIEIP